MSILITPNISTGFLRTKQSKQKDSSLLNNYKMQQRCVRIVFFKRPLSFDKKEKQEENMNNNSLAYLSSLLQEDKKKRIIQSAKTDRLKESYNLNTSVQSQLTKQVCFSKNHIEQSKKSILNEIFNNQNYRRKLSVDLYRQKDKPLLKQNYQNAPKRQKQLQKSLTTFCRNLKSLPLQPSVQKQVIVSSNKQLLKIVNPTNNGFLSNQQCKQKQKPRISKVYKHNIIERKSLKSIDTMFQWSKIKGSSFCIDSLRNE